MNKPLLPVKLLFVFSACICTGKAQSYHAFSGSSYGGVTAMYNNPASTVNQAFGWDVTLFSLQSTLANTAFIAKKSSLLNTNANAYLTEGFGDRYFHMNADANLFNLRFTLNHKNAFSFGFRLRSYNHAVGQPFYYKDTTSTFKSFLNQNNTVNYFEGYITHVAWGELNFNYARTIFQNHTASLAAGVTLAYIRGLSGAYVDLNHINFREGRNADGSNYYVLNQGAATAEYSANYGYTGNGGGTAQAKNFIKKALPSMGLDFGAEYMFRDDAPDDDAVSPANYKWKIGLGIMDIGRNKFNPINGSVYVNNPKPNITDSILNKQINGVKNIRQLRDTANNFFNQVDSLRNRFSISLPTRVVISVDRRFGSNFYVNAELSLNFYATPPITTGILRTRELNLLTVTPRWETAAFGIYLPVQYTTQGMLWVGGAIKIGPLLMGVHSLDFFKWFKTGTQNYNGGGYLLLSIHPFGHKHKEEDKLPCPQP